MSLHATHAATTAHRTSGRVTINVTGTGAATNGGMDVSLPTLDAKLEAEADRLLRANHAASDPTHPAYPERYLLSRTRRRGELSLEEVYEDSLTSILPLQEIWDIKWVELRDDARRRGCTERQMSVLEYAHTRLTLREIANHTGCSHVTVWRDIRSIGDKLRGSPVLGIITVLCEVFSLNPHYVKYILKLRSR